MLQGRHPLPSFLRAKYSYYTTRDFYAVRFIRQHIPYRNSMMTSVLRDSLGGNCKTVMIATVNAEAVRKQRTSHMGLGLGGVAQEFRRTPGYRDGIIGSAREPAPRE